MKFCDLPGVRVINGLLWTIILAGAAFWIVANSLAPTPMETVVDENMTLSILRSRPMLFLVTRQICTQIVIDHCESNWIGQWRGVLWASVTISHGVDVNEIKADDLRREGEMVFVRIPEPRLLSFSVEPGSIGFMSKATAAPKLQDWLDGVGHRRQLENRLHDQAMAFAKEHDMLPNRSQIVEQLNDSAADLAKIAGVRIRFE
jgi:hypothetical protein